MSHDEVAIIRGSEDLFVSREFPPADLAGVIVGYCVDAAPFPSYLRSEGSKSDSTEGFEQQLRVGRFRRQPSCFFTAGTQEIHDPALLGFVRSVQGAAVALGIFALGSVSTRTAYWRIASETTDSPSVHTSPGSSKRNQLIENRILSDVVEAMRSLPSQETDRQSSNASDALEAIVQREGTAALRAIDSAILSRTVGNEAACETLVVLAQIHHPPTWELRRLLLERYLFHRSGLMRDAAGIGLSILDDPKSLTSLSLAVGREKNEVLRKDFEKIQAQLQRDR